MNNLTFFVLAAVVSAVVIFAIGSWFLWRDVLKQRVVVQLDDGSALTGILMSRRPSVMVLASVQVLGRGDPVTVEGAVVIERPRVVWMQVIKA